MDIRQLEIFKAIAEHKSFSEAAKQLYLTQPTISIHMKHLEDHLGVQLFFRSKTKDGNNLTEAGKIFYEYVIEILTKINEIENVMKEYKLGTSGSFSLVSSHTITNWVLPSLLLEFKNKYPSIDVILHTEFSPKSLEMILNREAQFGIIRTPEATFDHPEIISQSIGVDNSLILVSPKHRLASLEKVTLSQLNREKFIMYGRSTTYWEQINNIFLNVDINPKVSMELNDINAVKLMVQLGMGMTILPEISVEDEIREGLLQAIQVEEFPTIKRYSNFIYHRELIVAGQFEHFIKFMDSMSFYKYKKK